MSPVSAAFSASANASSLISSTARSSSALGAARPSVPVSVICSSILRPPIVFFRALYFYYIILRMVLCKPTSIYDKIYSFLTFSDRLDFEKQGEKRGLSFRFLLTFLFPAAIISLLKRKQIVSGLTRPPRARRGQHFSALSYMGVGVCADAVCVSAFLHAWKGATAPATYLEVFNDRYPESFAQRRDPRTGSSPDQ